MHFSHDGSIQEPIRTEVVASRPWLLAFGPAVVATVHPSAVLRDCSDHHDVAYRARSLTTALRAGSRYDRRKLTRRSSLGGSGW
ncbi:MAG: hypothetical protein VYA67_10225 [Actinomycetota bacterium]|uniref:Uncharacterized protein n=1 Tax=Mycobacterium lentiflavum TaxID=141349 RepID=A0ABY3UVU8_MYCLN|nr:hypothetical protein [Mycobacterium lentiflavum]MEE3064322.1 hypothetical protein [Actinomycetota bacterium]ULP43685.1 hypothetical protein MJO58_06905 [Mycobacterium lentiflavum]